MNEESVARLLDERAIEQQLTNYCRAMDRCDDALAHKVFQDGSVVDYGRIYQGSGDGFIAMVLERHRHLDAHVHRISNVSVVVNGDRATSESYVDARMRLTTDGTEMEMSTCGRFLDRWEKRNGHWAITERRYLHCLDTARQLDGNRYAAGGTRDLSDESYALLGVGP